MTPHFTTYFDVAYAARGVAMIESLFRFVETAEMTVLCLDEQVSQILDEEFGGRVKVVSMADMQVIEPRLVPLRQQRSPWEFYATQKPVFVRHVLKQTPENQWVCFIDADTFFFSDPAPIFAEAAKGSVAVSPHRFNDTTRHLAIYGTFNAGFGLWRNDQVGRQCLHDWAEQCLDWCHQRTEADGRFMNQGYLNAWPARYDSVVILEHPGANLAPWNLGSHALREESGGVTLDGRPLVFFHFSGMFRTPDGGWKTFLIDPGLDDPLVQEHIFRPYLSEVRKISARLAVRHGTDGLGSVREISPGVSVMAIPEVTDR